MGTKPTDLMEFYEIVLYGPYDRDAEMRHIHKVWRYRTFEKAIEKLPKIIEKSFINSYEELKQISETEWVVRENGSYARLIKIHKVKFDE